MSMTGRTLGNFECTSLLGKGGMGEVYRAKDQKLGRDVAIKVLPEEFTQDTDRVARFQREAKLLASLNHPNIAAIYGLEESDGTLFLVLELVEGETLADQIKKGPIPVEEALKLALQIAEALEAAHEKGVIHRDLKPANIKVTPDGKVKVLDFGLAKAFAGEQQQMNLSNSPTLSDAATMQGVILGTAAYMSPEQAKGKTVDKRADVWAFGFVAFEMLTGRSLFSADDVSQTLARVLERQPDFSSLPPNLHPKIVEMLERCLQKDVRNRYGSISDARVDIQKALADPGGTLVQPVTTMEPGRKLRMMLPWIAAAVVLSAIIAGLVVLKLRPTPPSEPRQVSRFYYEMPKDEQFGELYERALAISADGRQFVYTTLGGLYVRPLGELDARLIPGTVGAQSPFFSPDGKWIGYLSGPDNQLKKIAISGGASVSLTNAGLYGSFSWGADDTIVYGAASGDIMRVSANGGIPETIVKKGEGRLISPQILPNGEAVLFTRISPPSMVMVQSLKSGERKELFAGHAARYLPTGHIVYAVENNLFAIPFDLDRLEVAGGPVSMVEDVMRSGIWGTPQYDISDSGIMLYLSGASELRSLVWVDRNGNEDPLLIPPNKYIDPRVSPDGTRVALAILDPKAANSDIWIRDLAGKNMTRLTFWEGEDNYPLWTLDGKRIVFHTHQKHASGGICWKAADGSGKVEPLGSSPDHEIFPESWSSDGRTLIVLEYLIDRIGALSMDGNHKYRTLLRGKYAEINPQISPNGRWMAYTSDESGQHEVYVRPFPDVNEGRWQVSTSGGHSPLWLPDNRELFYRTVDAVMAVPVKIEPTFSLEKPKVLFRGRYIPSYLNTSTIRFNTWDISPDGKRFLMMKEAGASASPEEGPRRINIVLNWTEELKQRAPLK